MNNEFWLPIKLSLQVASISVMIVFICSLFLARWMIRSSFPGKPIIETLFILPLVLPPTVVGFLLIIIFGRNSFIGQWIEWFSGQSLMFTWWAALIASTVVSFPLMYQSVKVGFLGVDKDIQDAARQDGANERQVLFYITIPLAYKSLLSGCILSFARALGEFGATLMFAGNIPNKTQTLPTAIYMAMETGNMKLAWLWVLSIIIISFAMLYVVSLLKE